MNIAAANDNSPKLSKNLDEMVTGQALTIDQPHRKHGKCYAEFVTHKDDGERVMVRKLISSMYKSRWSKPLPVHVDQIIAVHDVMARAA